MEDDSLPILERGVPIPSTRGGSHPGKYRKLLESMEVMQSFVVPRKDAVRLRSRVFVLQREHPDKRYTVRKTADGDFRVWRIK